MKQKKNLICNWWLWNWLQRGERDILGQLQFTWLDARSANVVALRYSHFIEGTKLEEMGIRTGRNTYLSAHRVLSGLWIAERITKPYYVPEYRKRLLIERRDSGLEQQTKSLIKFALKRCFSRDYWQTRTFNYYFISCLSVLSYSTKTVSLRFRTEWLVTFLLG